MYRLTLAVSAILFAFSTALPVAAQDASPSPAGTKLYFITPTDGETVSNPVIVRFGLEGMGVAPAGIEKAKTGHHHLVIDAPLPELGYPIPADDHYRHFGGGQTQVTVELSPGEHALQLILGDHNHMPHEPPVMSDRITITIK